MIDRAAPLFRKVRTGVSALMAVHLHVVNKVLHGTRNLYTLSSSLLRHVTDCSVSNVTGCYCNWHAQLAASHYPLPSARPPKCNYSFTWYVYDSPLV